METESSTLAKVAVARCTSNVLHILDHSWPILSGYSIRSQSIVRAQRAMGHNPQVVTGVAQQLDEPLSADAQCEGVQYVRTRFGRLSGWILSQRIPGLQEALTTFLLRKSIRQAIAARNIDVVHAHSPALCGLAAWSALLGKRIPLVYEIRGFWEESAISQQKSKRTSLRHCLARKVEEFVAHHADAVVGIGENILADLRLRGIDANKLACVPNGVEPEKFRPIERNDQLAATLGVPADSVVFGFIGSMWRFEGVPWLIQAAAELRRRGIPLELIIIGHGEDATAVKNAIGELGVGSFVRFLGRVSHEDIARYYSILDVLVYPRHSNPVTEKVTPLKPLEAMAQRKAVLASDVGGLRELLRDQETGLLFTPDDIDDFCRKAQRLVQDPQLRQKLGENARRAVMAERDWTVLARRYEHIYADAARRARRS
jgi:PEP-CTERM/exosortase A-associated glycosyltransferase